MRARCHTWVYLLGLLAGCRTPPATPYGAAPDTPDGNRNVVLAKQLLADAFVDFNKRPLKGSWDLLHEVGEHLGAMGDRLYDRTFGSCLRLGEELPPVCPGTPVDLEAEMLEVTRRDALPAHIVLHPDGPGAQAALYHVIDQATCRLDVLMFYWTSDPLGTDVAQRLAAKARAGVHVRVLIDGSGNLIFTKPKEATALEINRAVAELAREPGVEVIRIRNGCLRFDHRKLVVADDALAWTGGRNFTYNAFFKQHDLSLTLTGPLVGELVAMFEKSWQEQGGGAVGSGQWAVGGGQWAVGSGQWAVGSGQWAVGSERQTVSGKVHDTSSSLPTAHCPLPTVPSLPTAHSPLPTVPSLPPAHCPLPTVPSLPTVPNAWTRLVQTEPDNHELAAALYRAVDRARHHVYVENVYFSDYRLIRKLIAARRRGVDVRAVLTFDTGTRKFDRSNRVVANRLLAAGVRVYVYPIMIHTKAAAVDGCWGYAGTGNYDALSMRHNRELGLVLTAGSAIQDLEQQLFLPDFQPVWELKKALPVSIQDYGCEWLTSLYL